MPKIFVLDDEADVLTSIKAWGDRNTYQVTTFQTHEGFLDKLIEEEPEVILVDINLKDDDGRLVSHDLKHILPFKTKVILISADPAALLNYEAHYADGILNKPFTFNELQQKISHHLKK